MKNLVVCWQNRDHPSMRYWMALLIDGAAGVVDPLTRDRSLALAVDKCQADRVIHYWQPQEGTYLVRAEPA